jgi:hypothetical protein
MFEGICDVATINYTHKRRGTVYFPNASLGPGFFQVLSVYIHPSASVSLGLTTGFHSVSTHFQRDTRCAFSPDGRIWGIVLSAGNLKSSFEDAACSVSSALYVSNTKI